MYIISNFQFFLGIFYCVVIVSRYEKFRLRVIFHQVT